MRPKFKLLKKLLVLVMLVLLANFFVLPFTCHDRNGIDKSKVKTAKVQIKMLKGYLMTLRLDMGRLPTTEEGLALLKNPPNAENLKQFWRGPYLEEDLPLDPWHNSYQYSVPEDEYDFALYSLGADGKPGGLDYDADIGYLPSQ